MGCCQLWSTLTNHLKAADWPTLAAMGTPVQKRRGISIILQFKKTTKTYNFFPTATNFSVPIFLVQENGSRKGTTISGINFAIDMIVFYHKKMCFLCTQSSAFVCLCMCVHVRVCEYNTICYNLITWALSSAISWFGIILSDGSHLRSSPWLYEAKVPHFCSAILKHNFMPFSNGLLMPLKRIKKIWLQKYSKAMARWVKMLSVLWFYCGHWQEIVLRGQLNNCTTTEQLQPNWFCATIILLHIIWIA